MINVKAVCKLVRSYEVPAVLSTVGADMGVNTGTIDELRKELSDVPEIDRTGVNSWEDAAFRAAIEGTGRKKIVMCGLWTEVCLAFPTLDMLTEGYEVFPVIDAVSGISKISHESAIQRMIQAGAHPVTAISFGSELMRNWARPDSDNLRKVMRWYFPPSASGPSATTAAEPPGGGSQQLFDRQRLLGVGALVPPEQAAQREERFSS